MGVADYVLGNLSEEELAYWEKEMPNIAEAIEMCIGGKEGLAMNKFNKKEK